MTIVMLAEHLVGEARARRSRRMSPRERIVLGGSSVVFVAAALAIALLIPSDRESDPVVLAALVAGYALVSRVRFEFGGYYVVPEQLLFVPLLLLAPLPYVPFLAALAVLLSMVPDFIDGSWHRERALGSLADSWFAVGPVLILAALAPGEPRVEDFEIFLLAFAAQLGGDLLWTLTRNRLLDGLPVQRVLHDFVGTAQVDAILSPLAFLVAVPAVAHPLALFAIGPLVWLLELFSRDRRERYAAALELHRAYRGTVMLLSDVVEFDDPYTAAHSRSIVDLVHEVADEMGIEEHSRQELEFAALLHDVGKIAIPKEILNKPAALTDEEFEVMKTHTIEGQFMLDRVGGLLGRVGEIVRSCHERWDGGGYPDGLKGEQIPLPARIVFACDAYNAMTTDRVYRAALSSEEAVRELTTNAGTQFDPHVVAALVSVVEQGAIAVNAVDGVRAVLASRPVAESVAATP